jgi:DNA-binding winged helix-turn-helix (wHTH) protein
MDINNQPGVYWFGPFRFDRRGGGLFRHIEGSPPAPIPLGSRAFEILGVLVERAGELVTKADLMAAAWPGDFVEEYNLTQQISLLRRALEHEPSAAGWIQNVPRRGYRFVCEVSQHRPAAEPQPKTVWTARATGTARLRVGRTAELDTIADRLQHAQGGERQVVFVTGEAGIGKTTFVEMAVRLLPPDQFGILRGGCCEMYGTGEAFLPLIEALQAGCRGPHGPALLHSLRSVAPTWLAQMPEFMDANDRLSFQSEVFGATRERMLREFCDLLDSVSEARAWLIVLEDLHWSDFATLDVLSRFARRDRRAAVLVLATYRPADVRLAGHPVRALDQDLRIHGLCHEIALHRLSAPEVGRYLNLRFGDADVATALSDRVFSRTQGHPLFVVSLVDDFIAREAITAIDGQWRLGAEAALAADVIPRDVRDVLTHQIDRLSEQEQTLLRVASAAGEEFAAALVALATGSELLAVEQSFEALAAKDHILRRVGTADWPDGTCSGRYGFTHALYQEVLYQKLPPAQLVQIHQRLGELLEAGYLGQTAEIATLLARHFEAGRDFGRAVRYLGEAAANAARRFANQEAVQPLSHALDLVERLPHEARPAARMNLLRARAWARRSAGDSPGSLDDLRLLINLAGEAGLTSLEATALMDLSRFSLLYDRKQCLPAGERAYRLSFKLDDPVLAAFVRGSYGSIRLHLNGWHDEDAALSRRAIEMTAATADPATAMRRCSIEGLMTCVAGEYQACAATLARAKDLAHQIGDAFMLVSVNVMGSFALMQLGALGDVHRETQAALAMAERNGSAAGSVSARLTMGLLHTAALDFRGAITWCETNAHAVFETIPWIFFFRRIVLAKAYLGLREYPAAWTHLAAIMAKCEAEGDQIDYPFRVDLYHALAEFFFQQGDYGQARCHALRLRDLTARAPDRNYLAFAHRTLAQIALAESNIASAREHITTALALVTQGAFPQAAWRIHQTAATLHRLAGEREAAAQALASAQTELHKLAASFEPGASLAATLFAGAVA